MPAIVSDALILRTYTLGETSKVVVLLTRERGKLRAVAKGARGGRPRYQSALEPLSEVRASLHGRQGTELFRLGDCELVRSAFRLSSRSLESAMALGYFAELLDGFAQEGEAEDAVYRLALAVLAAADDGVPLEALKRYLEAWLLRLHGIYPPLDRCARCGSPLDEGELRYHAVDHGFDCPACGPAAGPVLSAPTRAYLAHLFRTAPGALTGEGPETRHLESFHQDLITRHFERALRSQRVMRDVARPRSTS